MESITKNVNARVVVTNDSPLEFMRKKTASYSSQDIERPISVGDMSDLVNAYQVFTTELPRVTPFYAVKCNFEPTILAVLSQLGTGFDCASMDEIKQILDLGVSPSRIIFANAIKPASHIKYAAEHDVSLMTFDNEDELYKVKQLYPKAQLVIRILPPDCTKCLYNLGEKFGCHMKLVPRLLRTAKELNLDVVGVSFHVGSHCIDATVYHTTIDAARQTFDIAKEVGYDFSLLDIGGGFMGKERYATVTFSECCVVIRAALDQFFPKEMNIRIIAEPGRYFVASVNTIALNIVGRRVIRVEDSLLIGDTETEAEQSATSTACKISETDTQSSWAAKVNGISKSTSTKYMYYLNDGVTGSFCYVLWEKKIIHPFPLHECDKNAPLYPSCLWGPTCSNGDFIDKNIMLPELSIGEWIVFDEMGSYTSALITDFNGMPAPEFYYIIDEKHWSILCGKKDISAKLAPYLQSVEPTETGA